MIISMIMIMTEVIIIVRLFFIFWGIVVWGAVWLSKALILLSISLM